MSYRLLFVWTASRCFESGRGIRLPLLCNICTMGKPNAGKQMARDRLRCTLHFLSLAMIVLPIIDGRTSSKESPVSGKCLSRGQDACARHISHVCRISSPMVWRLDTDGDSRVLPLHQDCSSTCRHSQWLPVFLLRLATPTVSAIPCEKIQRRPP